MKRVTVNDFTITIGIRQQTINVHGDCRERAEQKRLKRQVNKEKRGAMRELRKDAVFLSDEKDKEKAQAKAERAGAYQKAMSFLQQQESDFKSGGQGGMWKKGTGKSRR